MSAHVVARNYAEALLAIADRAGGDAVERFGALLDAVAGALEADTRVLAVMMSPRVTKAAKRDVLAAALRGAAPEAFIRFLGAIVQRGRQGLLRAISSAYQELVDVKLNRVHAGVVTAHPVDAALARDIQVRLEHAVGKTVVPHFDTDARLLGGIIVRIGDRVFDGSLRRRMRLLRHRLLHASPPGAAGE
jgi:F-type H+-transporting ATPase subunit delta